MSDDVLITPASRKIEFKDSGGTVDAKIETDSSGNLVITNPGGDISIGDTTADVFIGDGVNSVDLVFEQNGEIRGTSGVTLTLGDSNTTLRTGTDLSLNSNNITNVGTIGSGAITSTGASSFTDLAVGGAADSNYDLKVYGLSRFQGVANFTNSIQVGGSTIVNSTLNLQNINSISSGRITISDTAVPLMFEQSDQSNGFVGKWWRMPVDSFSLRFDVSLTGDGLFTTYRDVLTLETSGNVAVKEKLTVGENIRLSGSSGAKGSIVTEGQHNSYGNMRILNPGGAEMYSRSSTETGAIKITLPVSWTSTMIRMTVQIYEYTNDESFTLYCGGYNYGTTSQWVNTFAQIISSTGVRRNFSVRFAHDGSKCTIFIGELNSTWSYPQIAVTDFQAGFNNATVANWEDGWDVGLETSSFGTVSSTKSNTDITEFMKDGSQSEPALRFKSDPDTGVYRDAENRMGFAMGATTKLTMGTKTGYSESSYGPIVDTNSDTMVLPTRVYFNNSSTYIRKNSTSTNLHGDGGIEFSYYDGSSTTTKMYFTGGSNGGRLSLGTNSNPTYGLQISNANTSQAGTLYVNAALNSSGKGLVIDSNTRTSSEASTLALQTITRTNTNGLAVQVDGKVGIGTGSPAANLDLRGDLLIVSTDSEQTNSADSTTVPDATGTSSIKIQHPSYTDGRYTTRIAKIDRSGGLPIYFQESLGTANSYTNVFRVGYHSRGDASTYRVQSFYPMKVDGRIGIRNSSEYIRRHQDSWTNAPEHTVLHNSYQTNLQDYVSLKAAGNSTSGHGIITVADLGIYFGRTNAETGELVANNSATQPFDHSNYGHIDATGIHMYGTVHDFLSNQSDVTFNVGRNGSEKIQLYVADGDCTITADQDADENATHNFILNRTFDGTGANNFSIQKSGSNQFNLDTNANATFYGNLYIPNVIYHSGDTDTYINFGDNSFFVSAGGDVRAQVNTQAFQIEGGAGLRLLAGGRSDGPEGTYYNWFQTGAGTDTTTWWKICDVDIGVGLYKALALHIRAKSQFGNYGSTEQTHITEYTALFPRSGAVQDDAGTPRLSGYDTDNHELRIYKTGTGAYELQARMKVTYRDLIVELQILSTNGGTLTINQSLSAGTTSGGTAYAASQSASSRATHMFQTGKFTNLFIGSNATSLDSTGRIQAGSAGTNVKPSFSTVGDTDTGMYFPATGEIGFTNNNSESVRIHSSGSVGIGTDDPTSYTFNTGIETVIKGTPHSQLSIISDTTGIGYLAFGDGTTGTDRYSGLLEYYHSDDSLRVRTSGVERMRITSDGNVGIGEDDTTSINDARLVVRDGNYGNNQDGGIIIQAGDAAGNHWRAGFKIKSSSSGSPRTVIDTVNGNTGGFTEALSFASATGAATFASSVTLPLASPLYFGGGAHTYIQEDIDDRLRFFTGGAEFMRFTEDADDANDKITFYKKAHFTFTDNVANEHFDGLFIDHNISGSQSTAGNDYTHRSLHVDTDSSATGGDTTDEHRVRGIESNVRVTGDSDTVYGLYASAEGQHSAGTISEVVGVYGVGIADELTTGRNTTVYGLRGIAYGYGTGTGGTTTFYGAYPKVHLTTSQDKNTGSIYGVRSEVETDDPGQAQTTSTIFGVRSTWNDDSAGNVTATNSYLFYGNYDGTCSVSGSKYGVYINSDVVNRFVGPVRSDNQFEISGTAVITQERNITNVNHIGVENTTTVNLKRATFTYGASDGNFQLAIANGSGNTTDSEQAWLGLYYGSDKRTGISFRRSGDSRGGDMIFSTWENTERIRIRDQDGNVGIGNVGTSTEKLSVGGSLATSSGSITSFGNVTAGNGYVQANTAFRIGTTEVINSSSQLVNLTFNGGATGVRFARDADLQDAAGVKRLRFNSSGSSAYNSTSGHFFQNGGVNKAEIQTDGDAIFAGNVTAYGSPSDINLKENIETIPNAVEKVQKLDGVTFNYKKDGGRSTGLIAQQLQEVLPEVVYTAKDLEGEEHLAVRYGNVVGLLVEALKEQQTQIDNLTALVNELKEK